jgi:ATP-binding cassette subfamily F protein uup
VADFKVSEPPRLSATVIEAEGLEKRFGERVVLAGVDFRLKAGERVGLVGPNGVGKTTFLKVLLGELAPDAGTVTTGKRTQVAYYDQQRTTLDGEQTVYESAGGSPPGKIGEDFIEIAGRKVALRDYLDDLLFPPSIQKMQVKALSGGERNRLLLARLFLQGANVLVLDEPTNDLDLVTLNVLERLLLDFTGSVLLVTHDRYFLDKVATAILAFDGGGRVTRWEGNYADLAARRRNCTVPPDPSLPLSGGTDSGSGALRARGSASTTPFPPDEGSPSDADSGAAPRRKPGKLTFKEQRELEGMEAAILAAEEKKASLEAALSDPGTYQRDGSGVAGMRAELEQVTVEVECLYGRWQELEAIRAGGN